MSRSFIGRFLIGLLLILIQVLICNHIILFNVGIAFVFIYIIISLPMDMRTDWVLTCAFLSGLCVDIFSDTLGVNSLACTLLAMMKRPVLFAYIPRDDRTKNIVPSIKSLGFAVYGKYLLTMSAIYCCLIFTVEYFNFASVKEIVVLSAASAILTFFVLLGLDCIILSKREKRL